MHLAIAHDAGVPLDELWKRWADELPLWEAYFELDPPLRKVIQHVGWELARARARSMIYKSDFDASERQAAPVQSPKEMASEAAKIHVLFAGSRKKS